MTATQDTLQRIRTALEPLGDEAPAFVEARDGMPTLGTTPGGLERALRLLKERGGFATITLVTGVDHGLEAAEPAEAGRFEVVHQLHSIEHGDRVRLCTRVPGSGAAEDEPSVPTCTHLWPGASFMERECWDLFGIRFEGHPDLRRLLMPEGYGHHPLRKDFPHAGIEPGRLYHEWDRERREEAARSS